MKKCHQCLLEKDDNEFNKRRCNQCKMCEKKWKKQYHLKNQKNISSKAKLYREKNKKEIQQKKKAYYLDNKEYIDKKNALHRANNREYLNKKSNEYYHVNKQKICKKMNEYLKSNPQARIKHNLRMRINHVLKDKTKSGSTIDLLGCNGSQLKIHLESKFISGMSWKNYGKNGWHIDHIKPCASFDLTDPEQQKQCFHYSNLQPLWAIDNLRKSDKVLYNQQ